MAPAWMFTLLLAAIRRNEQDRFLAEHKRRLRAEKMQTDDRRAAGSTGLVRAAMEDFAVVVHSLIPPASAPDR